jgi:alkylation response protein AidB-like acyl-CoA dehydrogenase
MFASGIGHATWLLAMCTLHAPDGEPRTDPDGEPAIRLLVLPKTAATLHDVWDVSGLRGTGSWSFSVDDLVVPAARVIWFDPRARAAAGALYQFTNNGIFGPAFASVALGIADTCLRDFLDFASGKVPRGMDRAIRDNAVVQSTVALAQARLLAARGFLHAALAAAWAAVEATGTLEVEARVQVRLAATHATHEAAAVVDAAYTLAGSHAIFRAQPFERRFRDVHAVTQQIQGRRAHYEHVGRALLGLPPDLGSI